MNPIKHIDKAKRRNKNVCVYNRVVLKFRTEHGNDIVVLCANFQIDWTIESDVTNERDFVRLEHWGEPHDGCSCNHRQHGRGEESAAKRFRFVPLV